MWVRRPAGRGCPGDYQSRFVGEYDGLDAIRQAELGEYPADMDLHGAPGQVQPAAISLLDMPAAIRAKTPCSRLVRACCIWAAQRLPGGSARWVVNWRMRRLVAAGARTASPAAMVRIPATRLAHPEVRAVLAAGGRNQDLDSEGLVTAEQAWEEYWPAIRPVELTRPVERQAGQLAAQYALRGADAVHLGQHAGAQRPRPDPRRLGPPPAGRRERRRASRRPG